MTRTLPETRGTLTENRDLASLTWMRVGGPADWLFQPADEEDLAAFLRDLDPSVPVFPMGVGSNLIVRDGGIRGVVVRLGRGFNGIDIQGTTVVAGAAALDAHVARKAAEAGHATATDLADWLVRQADIPFREAHHITGAAVKLADEKGVALDGLSIDDLKGIDARIDERVFDALSVDASVAARASYGGTAPVRVREQVAAAKQRLGMEE